jgi:outer membrane protein OmpA-like peptidoglycan-associated protein
MLPHVRMLFVLVGCAVLIGGSGTANAQTKAPSMTLDVCPTSYSGFKADSPTLTCGCSAESMKAGDAFGANPFYWQSSICRAALHAGVLDAKGGQVVVTPEKAPVFPAVNRNGVKGRSWSSDFGFRIAAAKSEQGTEGQLDAAGRPVQAPIAQTLKATGRVQVYINFVTDSAQLQPSSDKVLNELLSTLTASPELRVDLIGHTDSVGNGPHNQDLSERRAAAVYLWLVQHGIARERLHSSGRGFLEPIATNDTDQGRALNRRVEVKALN